MRIQVSDLVEITSSQRKTTAAGYLIVPGNLARAGNVQEYRARELGIDGGDKIVRLFRPPSEVFRADAIASFEGAPLTVAHPPGAVDAGNWRAYAVGEVRDVKRAGDFVVGTLTVRDSEAIRAIVEGKSQLSCGYDFELDMTPGSTHDGQMRDIRGNHVAIVDIARGGPELRVADEGARDPEPQRLYGADLMMFRTRHGGKDPQQVAAENRFVVDGRVLRGRDLFMYRMAHGGKNPPKPTIVNGRELHGRELMMHRSKYGYPKENQ